MVQFILNLLCVYAVTCNLCTHSLSHSLCSGLGTSVRCPTHWFTVLWVVVYLLGRGQDTGGHVLEQVHRRVGNTQPSSRRAARRRTQAGPPSTIIVRHLWDDPRIAYAADVPRKWPRRHSHGIAYAAALRRPPNSLRCWCVLKMTPP